MDLSPHFRGAQCERKAKDANIRISPLLDMLFQHLYSGPGVSIPPPMMAVAMTGQLPKQPLQHPQKEEPLAAVTEHLFLWAAGLGEEVSPGTTSPGH